MARSHARQIAGALLELDENNAGEPPELDQAVRYEVRKKRSRAQRHEDLHGAGARSASEQDADDESDEEVERSQSALPPTASRARSVSLPELDYGDTTGTDDDFRAPLPRKAASKAMTAPKRSSAPPKKPAAPVRKAAKAVAPRPATKKVNQRQSSSDEEPVKKRKLVRAGDVRHEAMEVDDGGADSSDSDSSGSGSSDGEDDMDEDGNLANFAVSDRERPRKLRRGEGLFEQPKDLPRECLWLHSLRIV